MLGWEFLGTGQTKAAIGVFTLVVETFPDPFNASVAR
jgi:hypothetical protein